MDSLSIVFEDLTQERGRFTGPDDARNLECFFPAFLGECSSVCPQLSANGTKRVERCINCVDHCEKQGKYHLHTQTNYVPKYKMHVTNTNEESITDVKTLKSALSPGCGNQLVHFGACDFE